MFTCDSLCRLFFTVSILGIPRCSVFRYVWYIGHHIFGTTRSSHFVLSQTDSHYLLQAQLTESGSPLLILFSFWIHADTFYSLAARSFRYIVIYLSMSPLAEPLDLFFQLDPLTRHRHRHRAVYRTGIRFFHSSNATPTDVQASSKYPACAFPSPSSEKGRIELLRQRVF